MAGSESWALGERDHGGIRVAFSSIGLVGLVWGPLLLGDPDPGTVMLVSLVPAASLALYVVLTMTAVGSALMALVLMTIVLRTGAYLETSFLLLLVGPFLAYLRVMRTPMGAAVTGAALVAVVFATHAYVWARWEGGSSTAGLGYLYLPIFQWPLLGLAVLSERIWLWGEGKEIHPRPRAREDKARWRVVFTRDHVELEKSSKANLRVEE